MQIKLYSYCDGIESFEAQCDHTECFPDDPDSANEALYHLKHEGRFWTGGGAAPLFLLMRNS